MPYLKKSDYTLRIGITHLDEILEQAAETAGITADNIRTNAESWAQALIRSYTIAKYNIVAEFAIDSASTQRNFIIMQLMIDLALCTIHKTINPRDLPEHIEKACTDAMKQLENLRDGIVIVDLPLAPAQSDGTVLGTPFLESQLKFTSKPFTDLRLGKTPFEL